MVEEVQKKVDFLKTCSSRLARFCHITQKPFLIVFYVSPSSLHLLHFPTIFSIDVTFFMLAIEAFQQIEPEFTQKADLVAPPAWQGSVISLKSRF